MRLQKRSMLTALLASTALASPALAQTPGQTDPETTTVDEIVVTGIRASQEQAISIKRNTTAVVDAISAEDIGKLPDVTVADALQRIAGVQIRRSAGEGATVNIRGLPQVVTLMNGEQYLTPGNLGAAQPDLNDIPAQLMNSLVVYKSMDVRNALSGISGTIDLRTQRPFNFKEGLTTALAAEYATGEQTGQDDYLFNALLNWRNDRFGVMIAGVQSESNLGNNYSGVSGGVFGNNDWGGSDNNWIAPHGYDTFHKEVERKRTGFNGAFTWQIDDGFELTGEFFYTKLEEHDRAAGLNISNRWNGLTWTTPTAFTTTGVNGAGGKPWLDVTEYDLDVWWLNSFTVNRTKNNESKNYNLELKYDKGGPFTFSARALHGEASLLSMNGQVQGDLSNWQYAPDRSFTLFRDPADRTRGPFYSAAIAAGYPASQYSNGIVGSAGGRYVNPNPLGIGNDPQIHLNVGNKGETIWSNFNNPIVGGLGNVPLAQYMANQDSYAVAAYSSEGNQRNESELSVARMDGSYEFQADPLLGFINKIDVGLRHSDRQVSIESFHLFSDVNGCSVQWKAIDVVMNQNQCSAGEQVPNSAFNPALPVSAANPTTVFQGYTVNRPTRLNTNNNTYFLDNYGSITKGLPGVWVVDPRDFDDVVGFQQRVFGSAYEVIIPGNTYDVDLYEDSGYLNANIGFGNLTGDVGVRAIRTQLRVRQNQTGDTRNYGDTNLDVGDTLSTRTYTDYLPSVNLVYDFTDQLKLHMAYNKTMIPLDLGNYGGGVTISTADSAGPTPLDPTAPPLGIRRVTGATFAGSPDLDPWRSNNYDLTLEYYPGRATMFSIALFKLDIDSFVARGTVPGGRFPDGDGIIRRDVPVNMPIQGLGGSLQGVELGAKLAVSDLYDTDTFLRNFGFDGSFTYSDSSQTDVNLSGEELPFPDNSKYSVNAAIWYQSDRLQARVAYNYRTPRLSGTFGPGTGAIPIYQDTAQYVDVNVTYEVTDNVTVYVNGSNVFGEIEEYYLEFEEGAEQFHSRNEFEPRWSIGARARF